MENYLKGLKVLAQLTNNHDYYYILLIVILLQNFFSPSPPWEKKICQESEQNKPLKLGVRFIRRGPL